MPIYEYRCQGCGTVYEEWTGRASDMPRDCPRCGARERARVPSRFAVTAVPAEPSARAGGGGCCGGSCGCR